MTSPENSPELLPETSEPRTEPVTLATLFLFALLVRMTVGSIVPYPSLDDPAFYYKVAENLSQGRGLVIDALWSYLVPFASVTHPSNEYWQPLPSLIIGAVFAVTGPSFPIAQAIGAVVGATLAPITWLIARDAIVPHTGWRGQAILAALLVTLNPLLVYQSIIVDSSVYFAALGAACLWVTSRMDESPKAMWITGGLAGLSYLTRSEGLLLVALVLVIAMTQSHPTERSRHAAYVLVAAGIFIVPWWVRQVMTFGSPFPAPTFLLMLLPNYPTLFHYGEPSFASGLPPIDIGQQVSWRFSGLLHNLGVFAGQALVPWAFFLPMGLPTFGGRKVLWMAVAGLGVLYLPSALLFPVLTGSGAFYHAVGAVLPALTVLAMLGAQRFGHNLGTHYFRGSEFLTLVIPMAAAAIMISQLLSFVDVAGKLHQHLEQQFAEPSAWLHERHASVVMSTQSHSLHYASGLPTIPLPASDPPDVVAKAARRYGAEYIVGFGRFGDYPQAFHNAPGFQFAHSTDAFWIYRLTQ